MDTLIKQPRMIGIGILFFAGSLVAAASESAKGSAPRTNDGRFGTKCFQVDTSPRREQCDVSFLRLIATPERYDGRDIRVTGFLINLFGVPTLFLDKARWAADVQIEGITVMANDGMPRAIGDLDQGVFPVIVSGRFDARYSLDGDRLGAIHDAKVIRVQRIPER